MLRAFLKKYIKTPPIGHFDISLLAGALLVFIGLCLATITNSSIWFDEAFGAYLIRFDYIQIAQYTGMDVHPPFYYWLLKTWSHVFGTSDFALRSLSVVFGAIAIGFAYLLTHRLFGRRAANLSLVFMVLSPMFVRYSQEMRMYTLAAAIVFAATYVLVLASEQKKKSLWATYAILVSLGMWTHYFVALAWLSHWAWRAYVVYTPRMKLMTWMKLFFSKEWIQVHLLAIALFIPWMPLLIRSLMDVQANGFWIPPISPSSVSGFFTNILYYENEIEVTPWLTVLFFAFVLLFAVLIVKLFVFMKHAERKNYVLLLSLVFVPLVLLILASLPPLQSSFIDRYILPSVLAVSVVMAVTLALADRVKFKKPAQITASVFIAGVMIFGITNVYHFGNYNKLQGQSNNAKQIVEVLTRKSSSNEPIIADSPWLYYEAVQYSTPQHTVYFMDEKTEYRYGSLEMLRQNDFGKIKHLSDFSTQHDTVWLIGRPADNVLQPPIASWRELKSVVIKDSITGKPAYKAILFKTNVE